ncbi:hypothetical protein RLQ69_000438 [Campylobacter jejuni]|uniref:Uncharacterized protein n=1 Tax=Campylobacter jejuni TaxID=197 RepID=A0A690UXG9_CAMJU|nr:hypothetical protein [Campylobacter jejuni]EAJ5193028.1 hypothetical protein [Campylobacter jejuni]EAK0572963.1 hypothetical protein [Campylobacter jejuni]EDP7702487.1 hypothetical protein [Campylobacter jejuni]EDP8233573.1 hypothetical protein [Campylobacter jejuni]EFV4333400.1 hypothetical protein [Campylobacter jejuni]
MFFTFNQSDIELIHSALERIEKKLESLKDEKDQSSINKSKHLNECKESFKACLKGEDKDEYDFFLHYIYTLVWGHKPLEQMEESEILEVYTKVDKKQKNIPSLRVLAKTTIKKEVDELIKNHPKMQEYLKEYNEKGVPRKISIRQAKLALLEVGLLDDVEALIRNAPKATQINWEYATEFERNNELILYFQQQAKLSDEFVDELFKKAKGF